MKYFCLLLAIFSFSSHAEEFFAIEHGEQPQHLTPVNAHFDDYDRRIAEHLFLTNWRFGRFVARPSFGPELCVSVHDDQSGTENGKHFITVTQASESLWFSMAANNSEKKTKEVKVTRTDREISLELTVAIQRAWGRMLQHTKYPAKASLGLDGITLQFSVWVDGLGVLHGAAWAPKSGLPAEIAALGFELAAFASDKGAKERPLIDKLKSFEAKIPKR